MAVSSRELISPCKYCCLLISCHVAECWTAWSWFSVLWLHVLSLCGVWMNCSRETPISCTVCHVNYSLCWVMFKGTVGSINLIEVLLYLSYWLTQALGNKIVYALGSLNRHIFILPSSFLEIESPWIWNYILLSTVSLACFSKKEICLPALALAAWPLRGFILLGAH